MVHANGNHMRLPYADPGLIQNYSRVLRRLPWMLDFPIYLWNSRFLSQGSGCGVGTLGDILSRAERRNSTREANMADACHRRAFPDACKQLTKLRFLKKIDRVYAHQMAEAIQTAGGWRLVQQEHPNLTAHVSPNPNLKHVAYWMRIANERWARTRHGSMKGGKGGQGM